MRSRCGTARAPSLPLIKPGNSDPAARIGELTNWLRLGDHCSITCNSTQLPMIATAIGVAENVLRF